MDIYNPELWHDFFAVTGESAAVLAGLVFVAISINTHLMSIDVFHRYRALGSLSGFISVFLMCAVGLIGGQTHVSLGVCWLVISMATLGIFIHGIIKTKNDPSTDLTSPELQHYIATIFYLAQIVGSVLLIAALKPGIYVASAGLLLSLVYMVSGPWFLLTTAADEEVKKKKK